MLRVLPIFSGIMTAFAFSSGERGLLCFISLVPLFYSMIKGLGCAKAHFLFSASYHIVLMLWLYELYPLTEYGIGEGLSKILLSAAILGVALFEGVVYALPFWFGYKKLRCSPGGICIAAFLFVTAEFFAGALGPLGFPWGRLGTLLHRYPLLLWPASVLGSMGISFFILMINGMLALGLAQRDWRIFSVGWSCGLLLTSAAIGGVLLQQPPGGAVEVSAGLVQGGLASGEKWQTGLTETVQRYLERSQQLAAQGVQLIVWPETAIPTTLKKSPKVLDAVQKFAEQQQLCMVIGSFDVVGDQNYNALFAVDRSGALSVPSYKRKLVPMGEFVPFFSEDGLTAGSAAVSLESCFGLIGGLICYESIFPRICRELVQQGASLLVVASNDSWFGDSAALEQHHGHAVLRAVESGRWLIRAGNTGLSSIVSPQGVVKARADPFVAAILAAPVVFTEARTPYQLLGDVIALPGVLWIIRQCAILIFRKQRMRDNWKAK